MMQGLGGNLGNLFPGYRQLQSDVSATELKQSQALNQQAEAAERQIDAQKKQKELENKTRMNLILSQMGKPSQQKPTDDPMTLPERLDDVAAKMMDGGLYEEGAKVAEQSSLIRSHISTSLREKAQEKE